MFCSNCGVKNDDNAVFCYSCGKRLEQSQQDSTHTQQHQNNTKEQQSHNNTATAQHTKSNVRTQQYQQSTQAQQQQENIKHTEGSISQEPSAEEKIDNVVERVSDSVEKLSAKVDSKFSNQQKIIVDDNNLKQSTSKISPFTISSNIDTSKISKKTYQHPYTKLGGFLAFMYYGGLISEIIACIGLVIGIIGMCTILPHLPQYFFVILLTIPFAIISIILSFRLLIKIKHKDVDFLHFYIKIAILCGVFFYIPLQIVQLIVSISAVNTGFSGQIVSSMMGYIVSGAVIGIVIYLVIYFVVIWLFVLYFVKSVRVRTYMGTDAYAKLSIFTRNMKVAEPAGVDSSTQNNSNYSAHNNKGENVKQVKESINSNNETVFCSNCGAKIINDNKFCTKCGHKAR